MKMKEIKKVLKRSYRRAKNYLYSNKRKRTIVNYKKQLWQTDKWADSFVKGADGNRVVVAALMDKEVNEVFLDHCFSGAKVLDIGCGHGIVSIFLANNGMDVTAVDISEKLLSTLAASIEGKGLPILIKRGDAYNIPCADEYFDVVVARMFLPHFPDWPVVLKEMSRVTKLGGKILVHFNSRENIQLARSLKQEDCIFLSADDISNVNSFNAEADDAELRSVARKLGLRVNGRVPVSFFLYNRILGYQLGTVAHNNYLKEVQEWMKDKKVASFVAWFDKEVISRCSPALTYMNVVIFEKVS